MNIQNLLSGDDTLYPTRALMLYESDLHALVTTHEVIKLKRDKEAGVPFTLGPGSPMKRESLDAFFAKLNRGKEQRTLLPEHLLAYHGNWMLWWVPSQKRPIHFNSSNPQFNSEVGGKLVRHPSVLFMAEPKRLHVWALAGTSRPNENTKLFRAPYFNLYDSGAMCAGSVALPDMPNPAQIGIWNEAFFGTQFTHTNYGTRSLTAFEGGHDALWRAMLTAEAFPEDALVTAGKVVKEVFDL